LRAARPAADVRAAHAVVDELPTLGKALAVGEVSRDHVDVAVRTLRRIPRHLLEAPGGWAKVDQWFTDTSLAAAPGEAERMAKRVLNRLDPDGTHRFDPHAADRRELAISTDWTGMVIIRGQLDPANGAAFKAAIDAFSAPHPATTHPDSPDSPDGPDGPGSGGSRVRVPDERSKRQRQADAAGLLARIGLKAAGEGKAEVDRPSIVVHLPANESDQVGPLTPAWIARFACDSAVHAVDPGALMLGRTTRTATPAQRKFLIARDGGCVIPGCFTPGAWCDAHHVQWWSHDGPTDVTNMALVCGRHHTDIHSGIWTLEIRDGNPWVIPPTWIDPHQTPIRHTNLHHRTTTDRLALDLQSHPPPDDG
jgi:hypothetical protein